MSFFLGPIHLTQTKSWNDSMTLLHLYAVERKDKQIDVFQISILRREPCLLVVAGVIGLTRESEGKFG
jgi:hypothetical protein